MLASQWLLPLTTSACTCFPSGACNLMHGDAWSCVHVDIRLLIHPLITPAAVCILTFDVFLPPLALCVPRRRVSSSSTLSI